MASFCTRLCRFRPIAVKISKSTLSPTSTISRTTRYPVELSCFLESMMPLHSAIASARLKSSLSAEAKCWGLIPQGLSMPL